VTALTKELIFMYIQQQICVSCTLSLPALGLAPGFLQSLQCMALNLHSPIYIHEMLFNLAWEQLTETDIY